MHKIKRDAFTEERRRTLVQRNGMNMKNNAKVFDDQCSICMDNFSQGQSVLIPNCKHCFHVECLKDWINASIKKSLLALHKQTREGKVVDLSTVTVDCPNCNVSLQEAPVVEEQDARNELDYVLNLLESSSKLSQDLNDRQ